MRHDEFVAAVEARLGPGLEHATVQSVRELVAWFDEQSGANERAPDERLLVEGDPDASPEGSLKAFLASQLVSQPEEARQQLWMALLDAWFGIFELEAEEELGTLFRELPPPDRD